MCQWPLNKSTLRVEGEMPEEERLVILRVDGSISRLSYLEAESAGRRLMAAARASARRELGASLEVEVRTWL